VVGALVLLLSVAMQVVKVVMEALVRLIQLRVHL
jgi:hypothetical protein